MSTNKKTICQNELLKIVAAIVWFLLNALLLAWSYYHMKFDERFHYLYLICGEFIFLSRSLAVVINFNCALMLLVMNRFINSWIRCKILKYTKGSTRRLFDHTKGLHILCAMAVTIFSILHSIFHVVNALSFRQNYSDVVKIINIESTRGKTTLFAFLITVPGWSGLLLLSILILMIVSSFKIVRARYNEIFRYAHQLSIVFLILVAVHGFGNITKYQTNLDQHPSSCHDLHNIRSDLPECREEAKFKSVTPSSWKWLVGPLVLYAIDRILRYIRSLKSCQLVKVQIYNGDVIELVFKKNGFKAKPGQYVLLNCSEIAEFEWHPFTLTKCPNPNNDEDQTFSVHIKVAGDWTGNLLKQISARLSKDGTTKRISDSCVVQLEEADMLKFNVDGPYGSPNQDAFRYKTNVSVASGIGITPFVAMLNQLKYYDPKKESKFFKLEKLHIIWVCKSTNEFAWVLQLIKDVENHLESINKEDLLECHLFATREQNLDVCKVLQSTGDEKCEQADVINLWLQKKVKFCRPNFKEELLRIALQHEKQKIGLFFCGSQPLGKSVYEHCKQIKQRGNTFIFNKESFG